MGKRRQRWDLSELQPSKTVQTPQGYLRCDAYLTRIGIFQYRDAQGQVTREFRPADEVFNADSLESLKMVPVTMTHPPEGLVNADTAKKYQCGSVGENIRRDGEFLEANVMLTDAALVAATLGGDMREISCGYTCELEPNPGTFQGQAYDVVQRDIRYNHVAVVPRGRAGREVRLHIDAEGAEMVTDPKKKKKAKARKDAAAGEGSESQENGTKEQGANPVTAAVKSMFKSLQDALNGAYKDALKNMGVGDDDEADDDDDDDDKDADPAKGSDDDDTEQAQTKPEDDDDDDDAGDEDEPGNHAGPDETAEQQGNKGKGAVKEATTKKDALEKIKGERDALAAKLKELEAKKPKRTDAEKFQARVSRRVQLERTASQFLGDIDLTKMTNAEVKAAVVKKMSPELKMDSASEAYISGAYDLIIKSAGDRAKNLTDRKAKLELVANQVKQDEAASNGDKAHKAMIEANSAAWKSKPGA